MKLRSGTLLVLGFAFVFGGGWLFYRKFIPPRWMHNFAADIALRGTPDPNAPLPTDTRQATPRGLAAHPYICFRKLVPFIWDRLVILPSNADPRTAPMLQGESWPDDVLSRYAKLMATDSRVQLVVLLKGDQVLDAEPFYTFWADLSALAQPDGFYPDTAIFTAAVQQGRYVLKPVTPPFPAVCS